MLPLCSENLNGLVLDENIATSNSTPRSRPNTKPWLDTSNVIDSAPASTASLIFLVKETVSGVVFAPLSLFH